MNSSNSNYGSSGVSSSNDTNSVYDFKAKPFGPGSLSKPRLVKMRRQTSSSSHQSRSTPSRGVVDPGFNPFRESASSVLGNSNSGYVPSGTFLFGANPSGTNVSTRLNPNSESQEPSGKILDDMSRLNIANDNAAFNLKVSENDIRKNFIYDTVAAELPNEVSRLNIRDSRNVGSFKNPSGVKSADFNASNMNRFSKSFDGSVSVELQNQINKLNIEDCRDVQSGTRINSDDSMRNFVFGTSNKASNPLAGSSETVLPVKMMNLNIRDTVNSSDGRDGEEVRSGSSFGDSVASESSGNTTGKSTFVSDEMRELKVGGVGNEFSHTGMGLRSTVAANETQTGYQGENKLNDPFQAGAQDKIFSGIGRHVDHKLGESNDTASSSTSSSFSFGHLQKSGKAFEVPSMNRSDKNADFAFISKMDGIGAPYVEFKTPNLKGSLFSNVNSKFAVKKEFDKDTRSRKKKGKPIKPSIGQTRNKEEDFLKERSPFEPLDSFESYSPMDVSPYQEMLADNNYSRETSVTSEDASQFNGSYMSSESHSTVLNNAPDEELVSATHRLDISDGDVKNCEAGAEVSENCFSENMGTDTPFEDPVSGAETESFISANEHLEYSSDTFVTALDSEVSSTATSRRAENDVKSQFRFASISEDVGKSSFTFAASSSTQGQTSLEPRQNRKKHRLKTDHDSYSSTSSTKVPYVSPSADFFPSTTAVLSPRENQKGHSSTPSTRNKDWSEPIKEQDIKKENMSTSAASIATQEACEKWRLRGNQAYGNGDLSKAEDYYTQGVKSISQSETSRSCLRALMLCYSNRAATRMSLGRMREALSDCQMAAAIDPNFLRVQVRAAQCYLAIGEVENASLHFMRCLQSGSDVCVDRKLLVEASEGLEKAQKLSECIKQYTELMQRRTSDDIESALRIVDDALKISSYSEKLLEMKADALFMLRKYDQVIQVCEQTLSSAKAVSDGCDVSRNSSSNLWRLCLIFKSYFYLGKLEEALDFIKKMEDSGLVMASKGSANVGSQIPLFETVRELVSHKAAGNEAFKSGRHAEAVEHYTAALSCNVQSRPFAAICFCNRAAAYRALGQIADAIADCSLAIALDPNYFKAISRRAGLFETIRDYAQAATDLQRLVSLITKQIQEKGSGTFDQTSSVNLLRETQARLSGVEEEARRDIPLDMYRILGVESSAAASEIKKAYRKAALKHHPDKAGQSLTRSDNGDDGLWKEISENVHKDTDRLFKMIGEAYAVLSNSTKRAKYDLEEEMRNEPNKFTGSSTSRMAADFQSSVFERSSSRRQWQDIGRAYNTPQPKVPERNSGSYRYSRYA